MATLGQMIQAARKLDGISQQSAANYAGVSIGTYCNREKCPEDFRLEELHGLTQAMSNEAREMVLKAVCSFFAPGIDLESTPKGGTNG